MGSSPSRTAPVVPPGTSEVIRRLELMVTRRLDGLLQGDYRGLVPGHGSEPGETRQYQFGDDVRRIDWNVTARTQRPHFRQAVADRELETWIALDTSASMSFGTAECDKADLALACTAAVSMLTARGGNRVGAVISDGAGVVSVPPASGRDHLRALLTTAHIQLRTPHDHTTPDPAQVPPGRLRWWGGRRRSVPLPPVGNLADTIDQLGRISRRRSLAVVISDFLDPGPWTRSLEALTMRHDVIAVEVTDPREYELPNVGMVVLEDPETGTAVEVQTADADVRQRFAAAARSQREGVATRLRSAGIDHLVLATDRDWLVDLARFVAHRRQRANARHRITTARATP